ncbi:MAG: TIM barrel protein [Pseudomonadota bacterium]
MNDFRFSANTGFLWRELPFVERIRMAGEFGFHGVEFHDEAQGTPTSEISSALDDYGLSLVSLNTAKGRTFGTAAIPNLEDVARRDIDTAIAIAEKLNANAVHILSGCVDDRRAYGTYISNLAYALNRTNKTLLIEPISAASVPDYFLGELELALRIIEEISDPQLKLMFDCFHIRHSYQDLEKIFRRCANLVGHVQIASFPSRNEPFDSQIVYSSLLRTMKSIGYDGFFGCEYLPKTTMKSGINWRETFSG